MSDLIDRQAAIDALDKRFDDVPMELTTEILQLRRDLRQLPSADVAPVRHGTWGKVNECSECGCQPWFGRDIHFLLYCPNCGARMDGEQNG